MNLEGKTKEAVICSQPYAAPTDQQSHKSF